MKLASKNDRRDRRRARIRARVHGTATRPRLNVFRSLRGMFVQLIDDEAQKTIVSVNSKEVSADTSTGLTGKQAVAFAMGRSIGEKAKAANITSVVFDRGGFVFHGRVKAVADGAREAGLQF